MSSEANIIGYCRVCGKALGEADATAAEGTLYCTEHAPQAQPPPLAAEPASPYTAPPYHTTASPYATGAASPYAAGAASPYAAGAASPYAAGAASPYAAGAPLSPYSTGTPPPLPKGDPHVSPPLAFILGFIPGVGAVYNGQYAKGLMHVVIFGTIISILASGAARGFEPLFGLMIPTFVFYMAFEAYHTAKKRRDGEAVDEFSGLARTGVRPGQTRFPAAPVLLIAFGVLFLLDNLDVLKIGRILRYWPAALIALGLYLLYERISEAKHEQR